MKMSRYPGLTALLVVLALVGGCGKKQDDAKAKPATQVAAKVNDDEITVHQVNNVLARSQNIAPEAATQAKREILNRLIDQHLAKQQAIGKKLDRSPNIMQAIDAARSEILARAYLEKITAAQPKPTAEEVKKYYAEHPELFAQRRIFSIEEIVVVPQEGIATRLRERVAKARSMKEIAEWLNSQGAKFAANRAVRAAEQIPLDMLGRLQTMKDGETRLIEVEGRLNVLRIVETKQAPVDEATATPQIERFLFNQRSRETIDKEMKQLKQQAKIDYFGEFASDAAAAEAAAKAEAEAKAKALAEAKAKAEAEAEARAAALSKARAAAEAKARLEAELKAKPAPPKPVELPQQDIDKGVRGLR
jgi:EpsD family peptidyl-prolyl cis-trans isomerase